jgi:hypothetical protein
MTDNRKIVTRLFQLPMSKQLAIFKTVGIYEEEDMQFSNLEQSKRAMLRAKERDLVEDIDREIDKIVT